MHILKEYKYCGREYTKLGKILSIHRRSIFYPIMYMFASILLVLLGISYPVSSSIGIYIITFTAITIVWYLLYSLSQKLIVFEHGIVIISFFSCKEIMWDNVVKIITKYSVSSLPEYNAVKYVFYNNDQVIGTTIKLYFKHKNQIVDNVVHNISKRNIPVDKYSIIN